MGNLVLSTTMTVDGVIDGFEWYVAEGGHEAAGQARARRGGGRAARAEDVRGPGAVRALKHDVGGEVVVFGCGELARNLLVEGVVDELRFWVHPVVEGEGARPFQGERVRVRLLESEAFDSGVTLNRYEPVATT